MIIVEPAATVLAYTRLAPEFSSEDACSEMSRVVERCGRVSWKSEDKIGPGSADGFCTRVCNVRRDESIMEHASVSLLLVTDRYSSHQIVRHRIAAYTQESSHYINYQKEKFGGHIAVCRPLGIPVGSSEYERWKSVCEEAEKAYMAMVEGGIKHHAARHVLPGCLKTELVMTCNLRTWRHVFSQRTTPNNTPETVFVMKLAAAKVAALCPEILGDWQKRADEYLR